MYVIGLTGGVGSGKTEAARILQELTGAELLLADELGHLAMEAGSAGYQRIIEAFGTAIVKEDASIDRQVLASIVFREPEKLLTLNRIVHPIVLHRIQEAIDTNREKQGILIVESAIMFESGCAKLCDEVWYVFVPRELRIERLMRSRGYSREKSSAIIDRQMAEEEYRKSCQKEIRNDGSIQDLRDHLEQVIADYKFMG